MEHRQQHQRRRKHPRVPDASPPPPNASGVESTTSATPTATPKSSSSPSSSPPLTTPTSTSISVEHKTSSSIPPSDSLASSPSSFSSKTSATSSSSSSNVPSTTSTTSSDSVQKPTTMTGSTTTDDASSLQSTPSLTNPLSKPTQTINGNTPNTPGNAASKSISGGTIAAIIFGCIAGTAALLILFCFVRRKLRPKRRRHDWHARASFMHEGAMLGEEDARPVIGTQNALALARTNMGHEADAHGPEMTQMNQPAVPVPSHWGAYGNNAQSSCDPYQDQYHYQQPAQPHYEVQDPRDLQPYGDYDYQGHQEPQNERYAELARHLEIPPVALSPHPDSHAAGGNASPALARSLSTSAYGSLSAHEPTPSQPTRSGSPVDANPQQAYISPNLESGPSAGHNDGAYGGM